MDVLPEDMNTQDLRCENGLSLVGALKEGFWAATDLIDLEKLNQRFTCGPCILAPCTKIGRNGVLHVKYG